MNKKKLYAQDQLKKLFNITGAEDFRGDKGEALFLVYITSIVFRIIWRRESSSSPRMLS
jgi:hypothetical protein